MPRLRLLSGGALAAVLLFGSVPPAQAQFLTFDASTYGQALASAQQSLTQIENQITQIQRLESQLTNQAAMLQKMETDITGPIQSIASQATGILQQAQGLGYNAENIGTQFESLYKPSFTGGGNTLTATQTSLASWQAQNTAAIQAAMAMQNSIAQGQPTTTSQVQAAVAASQGAPGQTAAIQATNQLLATVSAQLTQLQNIMITQARAEQTLAAQAQASQATGAADSQRFWTVSAPTSRLQDPGTL